MKKSEDIDDENNRELIDLVKAVTPLVSALTPLLEKNAQIQAPIIRRQQYINFILMSTLIISVAGLTFYKIIDGSAATGLLGAIIGYIFGYVYAKKEK